MPPHHACTISTRAVRAGHTTDVGRLRPRLAPLLARSYVGDAKLDVASLLTDGACDAMRWHRATPCQPVRALRTPLHAVVWPRTPRSQPAQWPRSEARCSAAAAEVDSTASSGAQPERPNILVVTFSCPGYNFPIGEAHFRLAAASSPELRPCYQTKCRPERVSSHHKNEYWLV